MVDISGFMDDPLLAEIDKVILAEQQAEPARPYVGASLIGDPCARKIWYSYKCTPQEFDPKSIRRFKDGHTTEARIVEWLRKVPGIEIYTGDGFSDLDNQYRGHYDGVIRGIPQAPKTWHILEIKCMGEKYFKELQKTIGLLGEKNALQKHNPTYYAQAVTYMWYEKLDRHLTVVATPGARDLLTLRTEANNTFAKALKDKAKRIIDAAEAPERMAGPDDWRCKMCPFYKVCHEQ